MFFSSIQNYKNFVKWAEANAFKIESFVVPMQIIEETIIKMKWPLGYEYCPMCCVLYYIVYIYIQTGAVMQSKRIIH